MIQRHSEIPLVSVYLRPVARLTIWTQPVANGKSLRPGALALLVGSRLGGRMLCCKKAASKKCCLAKRIMAKALQGPIRCAFPLRTQISSLHYSLME